MNVINISKRDEQRLFNKIDYPGNSDECWNWNAYCNNGGYGKFNFNGKSVCAHRLVYEYYYGPISDGLNVLHKCDNPKCCNPDHLVLGTQNDNVQDMISKGRDFKAFGSNSSAAILDENKIEDIINGVIDGKFCSISDIMMYYKMSRNAIVRILDGQSWLSITNKLTTDQLFQIRSLVMRDKCYFTENDIRAIRQYIFDGKTNVFIAEIYGVDTRLISNIRNNKAYNWVK